MNGHNLVAEGLKGLLHAGFVVVVGTRDHRVRDEKQIGFLTLEKKFVLVTRKIEVARLVVARA